MNMPSQKALDNNGDVYEFVYDGTTNMFLGVPAGKYYSEADDANVSGSAVQSDTIDIIGVNISKPQISPSGTTLV